MDNITKIRITSTIAIIILSSILCFLIKPNKKELKASILTAFLIAGLDYIVEVFAGKFNWWHYYGKFLFLGLPVDMFFDFSFIVFCFCMGNVFLKRKNKNLRIICIVIFCIFFGVYGIFHNKKAIDIGLLKFAKQIDYGTIWFILGNYFLLTLIVLFSISLYEIIFKKINK